VLHRPQQSQRMCRHPWHRGIHVGSSCGKKVWVLAAVAGRRFECLQQARHTRTWVLTCTIRAWVWVSLRPACVGPYGTPLRNLLCLCAPPARKPGGGLRCLTCGRDARGIHGRLQHEEAYSAAGYALCVCVCACACVCPCKGLCMYAKCSS